MLQEAPATRPASSASGTSASDRRADRTGTARSSPAPHDIGFDYSFIIPATGDRVPSRLRREPHASSASIPPTRSRSATASRSATSRPGRTQPGAADEMQPSHGHDQTIVNGISRIGYMTGGKAALWKDEDMADVFTRQGRVVHRAASRGSRSSSTSPRTIRTCRACRTRASPARPGWGRAATRSRSSTGASARCSTRSTG